MKEAWQNLSYPLEREPGLLLGMTSLAEQRYCETFARETYTGWGHLVELGPFLGSLTIPLAHGLAANPHPAVATRKIEAYDLFHWHHSMEDAIRDTVLEGLLEDGEWFDALFRANTESVRERVDLHHSNLCLEPWQGGPIEALFVDAMKYDKLTNNIVRQFFPSLQPGSHLLHQDYLHFYEGWIHLITYEQRALLEKVAEIDQNGMVVFRVTGAMETYARAYPPDRAFAETPAELLDEVYAWNRTLIDPAHRDSIEAAHAMAYIHIGRIEEGLRRFHDQAGRFQYSEQFSWMRDFLRSKGMKVDL